MRFAPRQLFCARIAGQQMVRETGWVHLRLNRVPRAVQEMMRTLERVRPKLKLSPGRIGGSRRRAADVGLEPDADDAGRGSVLMAQPAWI